MIFWIFVILIVLAIALIVATEKASDEYSYGKDNKKFVKFAYHNDETICFISGAIAIISGIVAVMMLIFIIIAHTSADGCKASNEQRYQALIYKAQTESIRDEFGIINKEYIDEVQNWNEDIAKCKSYQRDFWIGIFFPNIYDDLETIDLEQINFKESED